MFSIFWLDLPKFDCTVTDGVPLYIVAVSEKCYLIGVKLICTVTLLSSTLGSQLTVLTLIMIFLVDFEKTNFIRRHGNKFFFIDWLRQK